MKHKSLKVLLAATAVLAAIPFNSFAAEWKQDTTGCWWQNDDGTYPANKWEWLDSNGDGIAECYYFDNNGYLLVNTTTPDGYTVNSDGAWVIDGAIQTQTTQPQQNTATTPSQSTDGYALKTDFLRPEIVNLIGKDISKANALFGEPVASYLNVRLYRSTNVGNPVINVLLSHEKPAYITRISSKDVSLFTYASSADTVEDIINKMGIEAYYSSDGNGVYKCWEVFHGDDVIIDFKVKQQNDEDTPSCELDLYLD